MIQCESREASGSRGNGSTYPAPRSSVPPRLLALLSARSVFEPIQLISVRRGLLAGFEIARHRCPTSNDEAYAFTLVTERDHSAELRSYGLAIKEPVVTFAVDVNLARTRTRWPSGLHCRWPLQCDHGDRHSRYQACRQPVRSVPLHSFLRPPSAYLRYGSRRDNANTHTVRSSKWTIEIGHRVGTFRSMRNLKGASHETVGTCLGSADVPPARILERPPPGGMPALPGVGARGALR